MFCWFVNINNQYITKRHKARWANIYKSEELEESSTCAKNAQVRIEGKIFPEVWKQIEPLIEGLPLVAHNKAFDESCLKAVFRVYQMDYPDYEFYCTCVASRKRWPGGHHNLDIIAARCGYDLKNHHHALADAEACAAIALEIL